MNRTKFVPWKTMAYVEESAGKIEKDVYEIVSNISLDNSSLTHLISRKVINHDLRSRLFLAVSVLCLLTMILGAIYGCIWYKEKKKQKVSITAGSKSYFKW